MNKKAKEILKIVLFIIVIILVAFLSVKVLNLINYKCFWKKYFGIICAGCGVTRMITAMFKLNFYEAFKYNQLFFILFILAEVYLIYIIICIILNKEYRRLTVKSAYVFVALLIIFMIIHNIPLINI